MRYYLGVDGGGSKTYALIADEQGNVVGKGASGSGNHQTGAEHARRHIGEAVDQALAQAGLGPDDIERACFGLAGADREADFRILRPMIGELGLPRHDIVCDTMIGLRAGTTRPYGVVLICGSGSNSAGRGLDGTTFQCGGFTYQYGDFGGGGSLSVEAFRAVIRAWDGREEPTLLTELVLAHLGYGTVQEMYDDYLDHWKTPPIDTAKLLFEAAKLGDPTAIGILRYQGTELGKQARAVIRKLDLGGEEFDVVLAGSVLMRGEGDYVIDPIREIVAGAAPRASIVRLGVEPVVGAVWSACEASGRDLPEALYERLRGIRDFHLIP
ncbi:kinase [Cohnella xylanilytica]|uniref:N-acetylglucosamine kinase n=1 Tax=Cohnella xylanilytica TaxID=557555 RepID=UPI001AFE2352|nr:BadF/BadG/BcrA/BcrD ATPase family protein [Cohnella xylanilytica]GIO12937.1 kinase [Cohnella xylanilytica]